MKYAILLYYKFSKISDPQSFRDQHHEFCSKWGLKGRVHVAHEGINGTVAGDDMAIENYKAFLQAQPGLEGIEFKQEQSETIPFAKLKTKVRPCILNMGFKPEEDVDPTLITGKRLSSKEWREILESDEEYVLFDIRNNYESKIGHFRGAVCPDLSGFTDFPQWADEMEQYRDKKILMYCTGGIRCEKFSSLLLQKGFKDVNQLHGGILNYLKEEGGEHFQGRCFVFDDRLVTNMKPGENPISECNYCKRKEDRYVNCANMECNKLFILCDECAEEHAACCSQICESAEWRRPFRQDSFRVPFRSKGLVFPELGRRQNKS